MEARADSPTLGVELGRRVRRVLDRLGRDDPRCVPAAVDGALRAVAEAWLAAASGYDAPLERVATPAGVDALLYRSDPLRQRRIVVAEPRIERVVGRRASSGPPAPSLEVEVELSGRRRVEDASRLPIVEHEDTEISRWREVWRLVLTDRWRVDGR